MVDIGKTMLQSLELLEGPLDAISPGKHYPCLHTMAIRVLPVMDEHCPVELTHYSNAIAEGRLWMKGWIDSGQLSRRPNLIVFANVWELN
jgi:hypothetical protein